MSDDNKTFLFVVAIFVIIFTLFALINHNSNENANNLMKAYGYVNTEEYIKSGKYLEGEKYKEFIHYTVYHNEWSLIQRFSEYGNEYPKENIITFNNFEACANFLKYTYLNGDKRALCVRKNDQGTDIYYSFNSDRKKYNEVQKNRYFERTNIFNNELSSY